MDQFPFAVSSPATQAGKDALIAHANRGLYQALKIQTRYVLRIPKIAPRI